MGKDIVTRTVLCPNEHCGSTVYESTYSRDDKGEWKPIWVCTNCLREYPRVTRHRLTNAQRAHERRRELELAWASTDAKLHALLEQGKIKSGAILVHGSTFDYHMDKLLVLSHPTNFDVSYHAEQARNNLLKAQAFVASIEEQHVKTNHQTDPSGTQRQAVAVG